MSAAAALPPPSVPSSSSAPTAASASAQLSLQFEFERAVSIAQQLSRDNEILKTAYNRQKAELDQTKSECQTLKSQVNAAMQSKSVVEKECEELYAEWQSKLKEQQKELESVKENMIPVRDMEVLRLKLIDELEKPNRERVELALKEMEKFRDLYLKSAKELAAKQREVDRVASESERELRELRLVQSREMEQIIERNKKLQIMLEDRSKEEKSLLLERENNEIIVKNKRLQEEITLVREECESVIAKLKLKELEYYRGLKEMEGKCAVEMKSRELAHKKVDDLSNEFELKGRQLSEYQERLHRLEVLKGSLEEKLNVKTRENILLKESYERRQSEIQSQWQEKVSGLHIELDGLRAECQRMKRERDDNLKEKEILVRDHVIALKNVQEIEAMKLRECEREKSRLMEQLNTLQRQFNGLESTKNLELDGLKAEIAALKSQNSALEHERERFSDGSEKERRDANEVREEFLGKLKEFNDLQVEYENLQLKYRSAMEKDSINTVAMEKLNKENEGLKGELMGIMKELESERSGFLKSLGNHQMAWRNEKTSLLQRIAMAENKGEHAGKASKYKRVAVELKEKLSECMREFASYKRDAQVKIDGKQYEIESLQKQLNEMEKQKEEWKMRGTMALSSPMRNLRSPGGNGTGTGTHLSIDSAAN